MIQATKKLNYGEMFSGELCVNGFSGKPVKHLMKALISLPLILRHLSRRMENFVWGFCVGTNEQF